MSTVAKRIQREINYIETILNDLSIYVQGGRYIEAKAAMSSIKKDMNSSLASIEHIVEREALKDKDNEQT